MTRRAALAVAAACLPALAAHAAEWTWGGSLAGRVEQISNPTLAVPAAPTDSRRAVAATGQLASRAEDWDAALDAHYTWNESSTPILDIDEYGLVFGGHRLFERDTLGLSASTRRDASLANVATPSGASIALAQRDTSNIAPTWRHSLTERWTLDAEASAQTVAYGQRTPGLVDFSSTGGSVGLKYRLSPILDLSLGANALRFRTDPATTASDSRGWTAGLHYLPNDYWTLDASFGGTRVKSRFTATSLICPVAPVIFCETGLVPFLAVGTEREGTVQGSTWNAAASYVPDERNTLLLLSTRSVGPSGGGSLSVTESVGVTYTRRLTDRVSVTADASRRSTAIVGASAIGSATRTSYASASLAWQLAERWTLDAGARWLRSRLPSGGSPESATLFVSLRYAVSQQPLRGP